LPPESARRDRGAVRLGSGTVSVIARNRNILDSGVSHPVLLRQLEHAIHVVLGWIICDKKALMASATDALG
jgi:hypothetical protein